MDGRVVKAGLVGIAAGFVGGLFGVGGGVIVVPGLVLWLAMDQYRASATSVAAIVASSAAALATFALDGEVDWWAAALIFVGGGTGAAITARHMHRIPAHWLTRAFTVAILFAAVRLVIV